MKMGMLQKIWINKIYCICLVSVFALQNQLLFAQINEQLTDSIRSEINKAINYLKLTQVKQSSGTDYYEGEWPSYIINLENIFLLGPKNKSAYDSNCFTTASVHNILAEYYLRHPECTSILPILELAIKNIQSYKYNDSYNFWHLIQNPSYLQKYKKFRIQQHRANRFHYKSHFVNKYANIFNDADDTAISLFAIWLYNKLMVKSDSTAFKHQTEIDTTVFYQYRDLNTRKNISLYNYFRGYKKHTGAFLTWFGPERKFNPILWFFPYKKKQNIIFGANDVDCVVNANVINTLMNINNGISLRLIDAIAFVNNTLQTEHYQTCGIYYPTEYNLHYIVSKSIHHKDTVYNESIPYILKHILPNQNEDGSWSSFTNTNNLQATLFATLTLLNIGNFEIYKTKEAISKSVSFIRKQCFKVGELNYWLGGIFFSGGTVTRYNHVWKSDAYTTALCIELLDKYIHSL